MSHSIWCDYVAGRGPCDCEFGKPRKFLHSAERPCDSKMNYLEIHPQPCQCAFCGAERNLQNGHYTYVSFQATNCAVCGNHKHTPLRKDSMGGYVCLTCIDVELDFRNKHLVSLSNALRDLLNHGCSIPHPTTGEEIQHQSNPSEAVEALRLYEEYINPVNDDAILAESERKESK